MALIEARLGYEDLPVVFDLTISGLAQGRNLLTLAFEPPLIAATITLLMAVLVIAWRAFLRFGPPRAELPELARGKTQLARNSAGLIERTRRLHLLGGPFADLVASRIAGRLGKREADTGARAAAIDRALALGGGEPNDFTTRAGSAARGVRETLLRAAARLSEIEKNLSDRRTH